MVLKRLFKYSILNYYFYSVSIQYIYNKKIQYKNVYAFFRVQVTIFVKKWIRSAITRLYVRFKNIRENENRAISINIINRF